MGYNLFAGVTYIGINYCAIWDFISSTSSSVWVLRCGSASKENISANGHFRSISEAGPGEPMQRAPLARHINTRGPKERGYATSFVLLSLAFPNCFFALAGIQFGRQLACEGWIFCFGKATAASRQDAILKSDTNSAWAGAPCVVQMSAVGPF